MYKVFFKESCFLLSDDQKLLKNGTVNLIHKDFNETKAFILQLLNEGKQFKAVIFYDDIELLFSVFRSCFLYVKAAGGVVREGSRILMIRRLGLPDLPKGHLEAGESMEECAVREVEEECGLHNVRISEPLTNTLHIYFRNENWYLKKTYWYAMTCPEGQSPTPQTEEDIEEVFWQPADDLESVMSQTYPSLRDVLEKLTNKS